MTNGHIVELDPGELDQIDGGVLFLLLANPFVAGVVTGAAIYLATEYLG